MLRFAACLCVVLLLGPTVARAQQSVTINALDFARAAIAAGQYETARRVVDDLLAQDPAAVEPRFLLGQIDAAEGDFEGAIALFRGILLEHPGLTRVRLDYALALFNAHQDDNAEYNFRLALAANPPETVRANIMRFLHAIRQRRRYQINFAASIAPDTNINAGTNLTEITLFGIPFTPSETLRRHSGVGALVSLSGEYRYPLTEDLRWRSGATLWRAEYPGGKFDDMILRAQMGPQWLVDDWELSALGVYNQRWYGNDPFYAGAGPRIEAAYQGFTRWRIEGDVEDLLLGYHTETFENGQYISSNLYPNFFLTPISFVRPILGVFREDVVSSAYAATGYRLGMGFHQEFPHAITVELQGEVFLSYYDAPNAIFGTTRRDQTLRLQAGVSRRDWIVFGFNPVFSYIFTRNASNQDIFAYRRNQFQVGFTKEF